MREIKFRGKRVDGKGWVYGFLVIIHDGRSFIIPEKSGCFRKSPYIPYQYEVIPSTVGQYTGLKDKNGKEIYEGDILEKFRSRGMTGKDVEYWVESVEFETGKETSGFYISFIESSEIIGNVFDNPELLTIPKGLNDQQ